MTRGPVRVLIVDDDASSQAAVAAIVERIDECELVGVASGGEEALSMVERLQPDAVTLDLEMPGMGGFGFLRLLMARRPTPVFVVSSQAAGGDPFKALELGALDFVAKPGSTPRATMRDLEARLSLCLRSVRKVGLLPRRRSAATGGASEPTAAEPYREARYAVCLGASTGGPGVIERFLSTFRVPADVAVLVAQHMPARFTTTFAERLARVTGQRVEEASHAASLAGGRVYVAPGQRDLVMGATSPVSLEVLERPATGLRGQQGTILAPSVDALFSSAAIVFGVRSCVLMLSGMGQDGLRGCRDVVAKGGHVLAQTPESAVLPTMPGSVISEGLAHAAGAPPQLAGMVTRWLEKTRAGADAEGRI